MRKVLVLAALLFLLSPAIAFDINVSRDGNTFADIGDVIVRGAFGADYIFFSMIILALFAMMMWQANMPMGATLGIGLIILFAVGPLMQGYEYVLTNISVLAIGALIGLTVMHFVRR